MTARGRMGTLTRYTWVTETPLCEEMRPRKVASFLSRSSSVPCLLPRAAQAANQTWAGAGAFAGAQVGLCLTLVVDSDAATVVAYASPSPRSSTVRATRPGFSEPQRSKLPVTLFCAPR